MFCPALRDTRDKETLSIKTNLAYNNQNKLLFLSFSWLHSDSLDVKCKRSPPVWPAEEAVFFPLQLQHKQVTNIHFCVNQEGESLVWGDFRPVGKGIKEGKKKKNCWTERKLRGNRTRTLCTSERKEATFSIVLTGGIRKKHFKLL